MITSKTNQTVKLINKLRLKKNRDRYGKFIVEGKKFVDDAALKGMIDTIVTTSKYEGLYDGSLTVSDDVFSYISQTKTPQGIIGIGNITLSGISDIKPDSNILYLDEIQDSGNAGTLIRTAACAGFDAVVAGRNTADLYSAKTIRATAGNIFSVKILKDSDYSILESLGKMGFEIIAADVSGSEKAVFEKSSNVLVIGNEGRGISEECMKLTTKTVRIPMKNDCESLNAAVSGAVLMYKINGYL